MTGKKIAIIPARGGSRRIPRKNIRPFAGKPIIAWSIETAIKSNCFDKIIVSTDDEEIASVARSYGAETPFIRPKELSDHFTGTNAVVKHAIEWLEKNEYSLSLVCCIYATAPFVQKQFLQKALQEIETNDIHYAYSVTSFPFPIQRAIRINKENRAEAIWPENISKRSQDLEETYQDAGQFYWGTAKAFVKNLPIFAPTSTPVILPRYFVQDIDTPEDWIRAEIMFKALVETGEIQL